MLTQHSTILVRVVWLVASVMVIFGGVSIFRMSTEPHLGSVQPKPNQQNAASVGSPPEPSGQTERNFVSLTLPAVTTVGTTQPSLLAANSKAPALKFAGANLRTLSRSINLTKVDYADYRLSLYCSGAISRPHMRTVEQLKALMETQQTWPPNGKVFLGGATYAQRHESALQFDKICSDSLEGHELSDSDHLAAKTNPQLDRLRAISREVGAARADFADPVTKAALEIVVTAPLYGLLESTLLLKLDYSALGEAYPAIPVDYFGQLVAPLLLCRMGDDCGPNGYQTLRLCRDQGICGSDFENALWNHFQGIGFNAQPLRDFIDQRHRALIVRDFSIFLARRKPVESR